MNGVNTPKCLAISQVALPTKVGTPIMNALSTVEDRPFVATPAEKHLSGEVLS
jgi:hypothetical protein